MKNIIPYGRQFIDEDDIKAVVEVLKSDKITKDQQLRNLSINLKEFAGLNML
jgi:perosamine synthetase